MWIKSENSDAIRPAEKEISGDQVILRRKFKRVAETEERPEHWTYEEWQMPQAQYEIYQDFEESINEQSDALVELAELAAEQDDAIVELAEMIIGG